MPKLIKQSVHLVNVSEKVYDFIQHEANRLNLSEKNVVDMMFDEMFKKMVKKDHV